HCGGGYREIASLTNEKTDNALRSREEREAPALREREARNVRNHRRNCRRAKADIDRPEELIFMRRIDKDHVREKISSATLMDRLLKSKRGRPDGSPDPDDEFPKGNVTRL